MAIGDRESTAAIIMVNISTSLSSVSCWCCFVVDNINSGVSIPRGVVKDTSGYLLVADTCCTTRSWKTIFRGGEGGLVDGKRFIVCCGGRRGNGKTGLVMGGTGRGLSRM